MAKKKDFEEALLRAQAETDIMTLIKHLRVAKFVANFSLRED